MKQTKQTQGSRYTPTWWKDTGILLLFLGIFVGAVLLYEQWTLGGVDSRGGMVDSFCWVGSIVLIVLIVFHVLKPGSCRRLLYMLITALANRNREAIPREEISQQLGIDNPDVDKSLLKVNTRGVDPEECASKDMRKMNFALQILKTIDKNIASIDELFNKIRKKGAGAYYPILRRLIKQEKKPKSDIYRILYEVFTVVDPHGPDMGEPGFRKKNLECLLNIPNLQDKWQFYCEYISICYKEDNYDAVLACAHKALESIDETDVNCSNARYFIYLILGTIYLVRKQFKLAIPYYKVVADNSDYPIPALFRLAYLYVEVIQDYQQGLFYAQTCFMKSPDSSVKGEWHKMEYQLVKWIAYCSSACGEYEKGCETLENYLNTAGASRSEDERLILRSYLSYLLVKCNQYVEAERVAKEILEADPRNATAVNVKGMCELQKGHYLIAARCFSSIIDEFKDEKLRQSKYYLGEIYNNLAICEARLNHAPVASQYFCDSFECGYPCVDVTEFSKVADAPLGGAEKSINDSSTRDKA